jgi:hypothetical protein
MFGKIGSLLQEWFGKKQSLAEQIQAKLEVLTKQVTAQLIQESGSQDWICRWTKTEEPLNFTLDIVNTKAEADPKYDQVMGFQNAGTVRHWVFPVNASALHWVQDGVDIFSRGHEVGGIKPRHFMEHASLLVEAFLQAEIEPLCRSEVRLVS